ncbi:hypothetical protein [Capnocytophaga granulosa]|jgi:hypothetical protein|uniref:hypothetical protein n=1 Tax=Capnocytophaga granulosa TaxID=45242 RepID=UPI0023F405BE|nr:hypothetical protein [Capnocytophaga granulosa]
MNNLLNFSEEFDFHFEVLENTSLEKAKYTAGCSGDRSDCCTRVCTRVYAKDGEVASSEQWEDFLEVNAGVVQY